jgi:anion-transporting  ArsA/GET3 family ATPase
MKKYLEISNFLPIFAPIKLKRNRYMITTVQPQKDEMTTLEALWVIIQSQSKSVRKALTERLLSEYKKTEAQQQMVKESLTRAFDELHSGKVHHDARNLFQK